MYKPTLILLELRSEEKETDHISNQKLTCRHYITYDHTKDITNMINEIKSKTFDFLQDYSKHFYPAYELIPEIIAEIKEIPNDKWMLFLDSTKVEQCNKLFTNFSSKVNKTKIELDIVSISYQSVADIVLDYIKTKGE